MSTQVDSDNRIDEVHEEGSKRAILLRTHLLVLLGYVVLSIGLTWPIAAKLFTEIPGGGDAWHNVWNLWWVKQAVVSGQWNLYHTDLLYFPEGVNLYFHTLALTAGVMSLPLQFVGFNLLASYNLVVLSSFVLAGYGTFLLCHYLLTADVRIHRRDAENAEILGEDKRGRRRVGWAAFVGGIVFAFAPYHLAHTLGHLNLTMVQWIPFYVLLLLKAVDASGRRTRDDGRQTNNSALRNAVGAGALLALNAYTDLLYAIFLVLLTAMLLLWCVLAPSERRAFRKVGVGWREGLVRLAVGVGAFALLVAPMLIPAVAEAQKGYAQQSVDEAIVYSSDAVLAFTPSELHPIWGEAVAGRVSQMGQYLPYKNSSERTVFLGYTVLGLSGYALWKLRHDRRVRFWAFAAASTWVLSLGPILQVFGRTRVPLVGGTFPMPYALLQQLPLLNIMRTPGRLTVLTMLALAVLVAFGMRALGASVVRASAECGVRSAELDEGRRTKDERHAKSSALRTPHSAFRNWLRLAVPLLILFEFLAVPFPTVPPGWGLPFYDKVAAEPGRFALLNLPLRNLGDYMAYQTRHGKPIIGGFLARQPPYTTLDNTPTLRYLLDDTRPDSPLKGDVEAGRGVQALQGIGVKYIVMNWWLIPDDQKKPMEAKLTALLDTGDGRAREPDFVYPDFPVAVWQLGP
ncbi:MAG TPA: hypothetical protein VJ183_00730 [Chloroflexia bacterium]|nr:hypothetical protein [Chloroflexia bacterium]